MKELPIYNAKDRGLNKVVERLKLEKNKPRKKMLERKINVLEHDIQKKKSKGVVDKKSYNTLDKYKNTLRNLKK